MKVLAGSSLSFNVGQLQYDSVPPSGADGRPPVAAATASGLLPLGASFAAVLAAGLGVLFALVGAVCVAYQRKSRQRESAMKRLQSQMDVLEACVAAECKEGLMS